MKKKVAIEILLVFFMALTAYGYFYGGKDWNSNSRFALVKAVVEQNRYEIDTYHTKITLTQDKAYLDGHYYSDKAIGATMLGIEAYFPFYVIYNHLGREISIPDFQELVTFLAVSLICACLAPFMYSFAQQISGNAKFSLIVTAAICVGTPFYKYSTVYYGHSLVGLFLFVVFFIWFNIKNSQQIDYKKVLISGYILGYAVITEYPTAVIAFGLGLYILYIIWQKQRLLDFKIYLLLIMSAAVPALIAMTYNYVVFHSPFSTGYSYEVVPKFLKGQQKGIMGLGLPKLTSLFYMTFHTTMGIFWQSPVLLLAFAGWVAMWKNARYRAEAILSFGIVFLYFLMMSGYFIWWGGVASTPRNIIPALPFFGFPLAFLAKKLQKISLTILAFLSIAQIFVIVAGSSVGLKNVIQTMGRTSINSMFRQPSIIYNLYLPNFINRILGQNLGMEFFHLNGFRSLIPFLIIEVCLLVAFLAITSKKTDAPQPQIEKQA